jgi:hypothetical protein
VTLQTRLLTDDARCAGTPRYRLRGEAAILNLFRYEGGTRRDGKGLAKGDELEERDHQHDGPEVTGAARPEAGRGRGEAAPVAVHHA